MRIVVTGRGGQVVTALLERGAARSVTIVPLGRPEIDLTDPDNLAESLIAAEPDIIVSAAAYTAVDKAESEPELANVINGTAPGYIASTARRLGIPLVHLSTDYVFDGAKPSPYLETDPTGPTSVYGQSKLVGEINVGRETEDHVILRTAWVYSPFGHNFVKTMLRLAGDRDVIRVVSDQQGTPTAAHDIADGILDIATNLLARPRDSSLRGVFHMTGNGTTNWAGFAEAIFAASAVRGGPTARVEPIATADYPTPAKRPANSRLDCSQLVKAHGVRLPDWRHSTVTCVERLLRERAL